MVTRLLPHEIVYIITIVLSAAVLLLAWPRRKTFGGIYIILHLIALIIWVFGILMEAATIDRETKIFWSQISYIGVVTVAPFFLCFILTYTNQKSLRPSFIASLFIIPFIVLIAAFTNSWHHLLWPGFSWGSSEYNILIYKHGFIFYLNVTYIFVLIFFGIAQLFRKVLTSNPPFRSQLWAIMIGSFFPILSGFFYIIRVDPVPGMDISPFGFLFTNLFLTLGFSRFQLLDLVPVAHDLLIERVQASIIVVDWQERIVDINDQAKMLFEVGPENILGKQMSTLLPWKLDLPSLSQTQLISEFKVPKDENSYVDLQVSSLNPKKSLPPGYLLILRDITARKIAELRLQKANNELVQQIQEINRLQKLLKNQATHDSLTGLFNRHLMDEILESMVAQADRNRAPLSIVVLDIDHFKDINDSFGHQMGDKFLTEYGECIQSAIRKGDFACRLGGDEFLIAFPHMETDQALKRANDLRLILHEIVIAQDQVQVRTTASLGVATYPHHGDAIAQIINAADQAMYSAKEKGRNLAEKAA
ncbi:MAG: diguanylate cyclase [Anaerolineaceae bacterium]|nr:diguanylate cyclase [Anaerolineaceae bacterium]